MQKPSRCDGFYVVGLVRLELTTLCSQSRCATNCATARYYFTI